MHKMLTLFIVGVILYSIMQNKKATPLPNNNDTPQSISEVEVPTETTPENSEVPDPALRGNFIEKSLSKVLINVLKTPEGRAFLEKTIRPQQDPISGTQYTLKVNNNLILNELFKIKTIAPGEGPRASCGHFAYVNYLITNAHGVLIDSGQGKTLKLGAMEVIPGLDSVITGMQVGEKRTAVIHKKYAYASHNFKGVAPKSPTEYYMIDITLLDIKPNNFGDDDIKIFDDEIAYSIPCLCGDYIEFNTKITKIDGTILYDSHTKGKQIGMFIGDTTYPMIFSHALFNKIPVGKRTVICKGNHLRGLASQKMTKIFPKNQPEMDDFYLIEFSDFKTLDSHH